MKTRIIVGLAVSGVLLAALLAFALLAPTRRNLGPLVGPTTVEPSTKYIPTTHIVNLQPIEGVQSLARYVDLNVGDHLSVTRADGKVVRVEVDRIEIDANTRASPRVRVDLRVGTSRVAAFGGMWARSARGIRPVEVDGIKIAVEVTQLLFSQLRGGSSPFLTFERLRLQRDLRLAIWDASLGIMPGVSGKFVLKQPAWTRECFGNWLHSTGYGIHSAIDIYSTADRTPEEVRSPVAGTIYRVYNRDASPDDSRRSKAINIYGDQIVGPRGQRALYRFQHLSEIYVDDGDSVAPGQVLGLTGHTGFDPSLADHLHFEIRLNPSHFGLPFDDDLFATIAVNPYNYLLEWYEAEMGSAACPSRPASMNP